MLTRAAVVTLLASVAFVASPAKDAAAAFSAGASGSGQATLQSIPQSGTPVAVASGREVTVSWSVTTLSGGTPAAAYTVRRYDASHVAQTVLDGCVAVTATTCVEHNVPIGSWTYSVQALMGSWIGAEGAQSAAITVAASSFVLDATPPIASLPATVTGTIGSFLTGETLTYRLDSATGPVIAGTPSTVTSSASTPVSVTVPAGTSDAPHSVFVVGSLGSFAAAAIDIVIAPHVQSMQMGDVNGNGKVDRVTVVFDDVLAAYTAGVAPWTLTNVPSGGSLSSVGVSGNTATLTIAEGPGAANTAVGTFTVALAANSAGIRDVNGHPSSFTAATPLDAAKPMLVTLSVLDSTGNGKVDRVTVLFSEPLATYSAPNTIWTLTNVPSGGTLASVALVSATLTLTLAEGGSPENTAVGTMTVAMASNSLGARDSAGNLASFAATGPIDKAGPAAVTITDSSSGTNGKAEPGDTIVITFSEPLAPASVPSSTTVTLSDPAGTGNDTLAMTGVSNGAGDLGSNTYITNNGTVASFASSAVALSNANKTITVTIGTTCSGTGCGSGIGTQGSAANYSFVAATTLTDAAGNPAATAAKIVSIRLF